MTWCVAIKRGEFFHRYYRRHRHLPLYVTWRQRPWAELRTDGPDASDGSTQALAYLVERIRERWPETRIVAGGDSDFARDGKTW
jgi:hypothetical protein